jgi:ribosomal protein S3AE
MVPYPVPSNAADDLIINTKSAGSQNLYVVAITEGNKKAVKNVLFQIMDCSGSNVIVTYPEGLEIETNYNSGIEIVRPDILTSSKYFKTAGNVNCTISKYNITD